MVSVSAWESKTGLDSGINKVSVFICVGKRYVLSCTVKTFSNVCA